MRTRSSTSPSRCRSSSRRARSPARRTSPTPFFFPATSTNPNNYNKGRLNCAFFPGTTLAIEKTAFPATALPANTTTEAGFTVTVTNVGRLARGVTVEDPALPSFLGNVGVTATSSDPAANPVVVSTMPLRVRADRLAAGASITVEITGDAAPTCAHANFSNVASAFAVNAGEVSAEAVLTVQKGDGKELCDGADNDCDGKTDVFV